MTDRYERIREALEAGPTPGKWTWKQVGSFNTPGCAVFWPDTSRGGVHYRRLDSGGGMEQVDAEFIAACHPEAIRALLAERDALIHDNAEYVRAANELAAENERLRAELEIERLKLAAIGAVAHGSEQRLDQDSPYRSDAYDTVCRLAEMAHDELAKDAARYRCLRKGNIDDIAVVRGLGAMDYGMSGVAYTYSEEIDGDDLDAAIDAAMAAAKGESNG